MPKNTTIVDTLNSGSITLVFSLSLPLSIGMKMELVK